MIFVYTGNGKGKTSACIGQAIRALGRELRVGFAQFMKQPGKAGEQNYLEQILGENFMAGGIGFFVNESDRPAHRQAALNTLQWAYDRYQNLDVLILDECIYAYNYGLLIRDEFQELLELFTNNPCHLIISGRNFPEEWYDNVDLITSMTEIKHPWKQGISATPGLDF